MSFSKRENSASKFNMNKTIRRKAFVGFFCCALCIGMGCSGGSDDSTDPVPPIPPVTPEPTEEKISINLSLEAETCATEIAFETADRIGLYVVNYVDDSPVTLQATGNQANNMGFTYTSNVWISDTQLYWRDKATKADFYCFYPYTNVTHIADHHFIVKDNQSTWTNYKASAFLWGKAGGISPTSSAVNIAMQSVLSNVVVKIEAGEGFTPAQLASAAISVKLGQVKTEANINLSTGIATATGTAQTVIPFKDADIYRVLVVPQTVSENNFITATVDGRDYTMSRNFTFIANTQHTFTLKITRTSNGINIDVGSWETDDIDHGGIAQ